MIQGWCSSHTSLLHCFVTCYPFLPFVSPWEPKIDVVTLIIVPILLPVKNLAIPFSLSPSSPSLNSEKEDRIIVKFDIPC